MQLHRLFPVLFFPAFSHLRLSLPIGPFLTNPPTTTRSPTKPNAKLVSLSEIAVRRLFSQPQTSKSRRKSRISHISASTTEHAREYEEHISAYPFLLKYSQRYISISCSSFPSSIPVRRLLLPIQSYFLTFTSILKSQTHINHLPTTTTTSIIMFGFSYEKLDEKLRSNSRRRSSCQSLVGEKQRRSSYVPTYAATSFIRTASTLHMKQEAWQRELVHVDDKH